MEASIESGNGLPIYILAPCLLGFLVMLIPVLRRINSSATKFLIVALWLRFFMSALHVITFDSSPVGLSWNALGSIGVTVAGGFIIRHRPALGILFPAIALVTLVIVSGFVADDPARALSVIVKYVYFIVIALAVVDALEDIGPTGLSDKLLAPFVIPVSLQVLSVLIGASKGTEDGGGVSYIGGFNHESSFSIILLSGLFLLCCSSYRLWLKATLFSIFVGGILLANYRTAILSAGPLIGVTLFTAALRRFVPDQRGFVSLLLILLGGVGFLAIASQAEERFADLAVVARQNTDIIKDPETFTLEDRHVFSGRTLIWSRYIYGYKNSDALQKIIGNGPESWGPVFGIYAHNTLVSTLYEYGILGIILVVLLWAWMLVLAVRGRIRMRSRLIAAHLSFFILAMATMPMWLIEGLLLYSLICGYSIYAFRQGDGRIPRVGHGLRGGHAFPDVRAARQRR